MLGARPTLPSPHGARAKRSIVKGLHHHWANMKNPLVLILGPDRGAVSGVSTHLNALFGSSLERHFRLEHFQVGSANRKESAAGRVLRGAVSPFQLAAAIVQRNPAIVHVNTSIDAKAYWRDLVYVLVAKLFGVRVVYQTHGGALRVFCGKSHLLRRMVGTALGWPDVVVTIAQVETESARELQPSARVVLLPNGTDCTALINAERPASDPRAPLRLLYMGRLVRTKGLFETLQAVRLLRNRGVETHLTIAGSGPIEQELRQRAQTLHIEDLTTFAGAVFGERKMELLRQGEVALLPSYHLEGLPYALLEGMAAGQAPIVTRIGATPEVVHENVHGLFVPPRDPEALARAIGALAADRAKLARMGAASRQRVATDYSVERLAADFTALYRSLIEGAVPASSRGMP